MVAPLTIPLGKTEPMRALITRPREDAEELAQELRRRGLIPVLAPLLTIRNRAGVVPQLDGVQALLLTSANGARALAAATGNRELPVYAVGDATARAASGLGFDAVENAGGDVEDLARLVAENLNPKSGALYHAAGTRLAGDLARRLRKDGFTVLREALYEAKAATELPAPAKEGLAEGSLDLAMFFSPRTAAAFATLVTEAALASACELVAAYALSPAVRDALSWLPWRAIGIAARPDQESLLAAVDADYSGAQL